MGKANNIRFVCAVTVLSSALSAWGQPSEEEDLAMAYGDKSFVTIATGTRVPVNRAPAVATVITAEDIKALGAVDLDEVLETVPGMHVARGTQTNMPVYVIRGVHRDYNPQVLMLVNGIPITASFAGNRGDVWGGLPLENVARIEIIRGPGSALYGADAFTGVINITTKTAGDIDGTQFGVRAGSFKTRDAWMLHGGTMGAVEVAGYLRVGRTDGPSPTIAADAASPLGGGISHAPGPMNNGRDSVDGSLDLSYDKWRLRFGYQERDNVGSGTGVANALDPTGHSYSERLTSDLTYRNPEIARNWGIEVQASYMRYKEFSDLVLFPAGSNLGGGVFTDGMIGNPYKWEQHGRFNASAAYTGFDGHQLRFGAGVTRDELYKVRETKNFLPAVLPFTPIGTGSYADVIDVSDTAPFLRPHQRTVHHWFVQDEWSLAKDWTLTAGVRRDNYSDFGQTTNPRVALAWEAAYNLTAKLLYGTAFRAPAFIELYNINNPVVIGTPTLAPEKMRTAEAAVSWQVSPRLQLGMNVFRYQMRDMIQLVGTTYMNTGKQTGKGMELEAAWDVSRELRLSGNYSYQKSIDEATQQDAGLAPHHHAYLRADWRFMAGWAANMQLNAVGERLRAPGDTRGALRGYNTIDATLRTDRGQKWNYAVTLRNIFNVDAREPAPAAIPNDFPLAGRAVYLQADYRL
ncbi:MAG: TonB-dependent receptor plug domain-containing protein [Ignavibacteria bacterium]